MGIEPDLSNRRPLKSRGSGWASAITRLLLKTPLTANQVSVIGVLISLLGAWAFVAAPACPWLYLAGALAIQLRLLCNMFDGLVAVEGGRKSAYGPLYNEVPDRIEDSVFLSPSAMPPACSGSASPPLCSPRSPLMSARSAARSASRRTFAARWRSSSAWRR